MTLASLPESFSVLFTALEANENAPKMEIVTGKQKEKNRCSA